MIGRWRFGLVSRLLVVHLEIPGVRLTASGPVRSSSRRIVVLERGDLL